MRPPLPIGTYGEINTRRLPTGKWVARAYYRDDTGKRRDITARGKNKAAATRALKTKISEHQQAGFTGDTWLRDFAQAWLTDYKKTVSEGSATVFERTVKNYITPAGNIRLREITVPWLDARITAAIESKGKLGGPAAAARLRTAYKMILTEAVRQGALRENPGMHTRAVPQKKRKPKALTADQLRKLRKNVHAYYQANPHKPEAAWAPGIIDFMAGTGVRPGEAIALTWEALNLPEAQATIKATMVMHDGQPTYREGTKTGNDRIVLLPEWLVKSLEGRERTHELVFASRTGGIISHSALGDSFKRSVGEEFREYSPKILRATVATLIEREQGLEAAALQLGHETTMTTRGSYVERRGISDARDVLDSL